MTDLNDYITRHLRPHDSEFFGAMAATDDDSFDYELEESPQEYLPPSLPRVAPPTNTPRRSMPRVPMGWDGGPGVKDHSLIKSILRRSGML